MLGKKWELYALKEIGKIFIERNRRNMFEMRKICFEINSRICLVRNA